MEQEHQRAPLTVSSGADQVGEDYRDHEAEFPSSQPRRRIGTMESLSSAISAWSEGKKSSHNRWRHTLGIVLLLITVVLWTSCGFLASTIFADNTYSKPYLITYTNTSFFMIPLAPMVLKSVFDNRRRLKDWRSFLQQRVGGYSVIADAEDEERAAFIKSLRGSRDGGREGVPSSPIEIEDELGESQLLSRSGTSTTVRSSMTVAETARLSAEFCIPWFLANYFASACLEYTTVASSTILTSTSSIWTLIVGASVGVEHFTFRKLLGVCASLAGIILISSVDISGKNDENRGTFPHKTSREIMTGDFLAFLSAVLYGLYIILMKKRVGDEGRVNMPLFFGFLGMFNVLALWPGLIILHLMGVEKFELPPTRRVLTIILLNATASMVSDFCWAFSMLLTSPLIVTVGLSLTIPLSLIGQMVIESQYSSFVYWVGAGIVFLSFIFINNEESKDEEMPPQPYGERMD